MWDDNMLIVVRTCDRVIVYAVPTTAAWEPLALPNKAAQRSATDPTTVPAAGFADGMLLMVTVFPFPLIVTLPGTSSGRFPLKVVLRIRTLKLLPGPGFPRGAVAVAAASKKFVTTLDDTPQGDAKVCASPSRSWVTDCAELGLGNNMVIIMIDIASGPKATTGSRLMPTPLAVRFANSAERPEDLDDSLIYSFGPLFLVLVSSL